MIVDARHSNWHSTKLVLHSLQEVLPGQVTYLHTGARSHNLIGPIHGIIYITGVQVSHTHTHEFYHQVHAVARLFHIKAASYQFVIMSLSYLLSGCMRCMVKCIPVEGLAVDPLSSLGYFPENTPFPCPDIKLLKFCLLNNG